ncbi:dynactin [Pestalotiopsis sp. NC0098]|nr:dynactin [Pestalotiopsis sp. NC0098]
MSRFKVGQTVEINADGRLATVKFVGGTSFSPGEWIGLELEDGSGKNDGSVQGVRYFECDMGRGMFVKPGVVTVIKEAPPPRPKPTTARSGRTSVVPQRPSSISTDPTAARRKSINAPSPSPVRSRPSSIARSPTRPERPTAATAASSSSTSRTGTPSGAAARKLSSATRPGVGTTRSSMGPPVAPDPTKRRSSNAATGTTPATRTGAARPLSGRQSLAPTGRGGAARSPSGRVRSTDSSGNESPGNLASPNKSDDEVSPVQARTQALDRLTAGGYGPAATTTTKPRASTSGRPSAAANSAAIRENEDLKTKLRILESKRTEDKEQLKQLEKLQDQIARYQTVNKKVEEKFMKAQSEANHAKQRLQDADARIASIDDMQAEHETTMELLLVEKEVAEEESEHYKLELDSLKAKLEEMELENEVLRLENTEFEQDVTAEEKTSDNWIALQKKNELYYQAIITLHDKLEQLNEKTSEEIKALKSDLDDFDNIKQEYDIAKEKILEAEARCEHFKGQLEDALGAEEMIEKLSEDNQLQSDTITTLRENLKDLEELKEISDELEINHLEHEKELEKIIESKDSNIFKLTQQMVDQNKDIDDMEYTIGRFKELVSNLQKDLEEMEASNAMNEAESEQINSKSRELLDLNQKLQINAAKTQAKTIELELERMHAAESKQHLEIVTLFLPESYDQDKDSVQSLLKFMQMSVKSDLLATFIKERVTARGHPGHEDDIFIGCDAIGKLTWVSSMCRRFVNHLKHCSLEEFAGYNGATWELQPVDAKLNSWIDNLQKGTGELQLKEYADELSRSIKLLEHLAEQHISGNPATMADKMQMQTALMQNYLESAAITFSAMKEMVQRVLPQNTELDVDEPWQTFDVKVDLAMSQTRSTKVIVTKAVRSLEDLQKRSLVLNPEEASTFEDATTVAQRLAEMAQAMAVAVHALTSEADRDEPLTYSDISRAIHNVVKNDFKVEDSELLASYQAGIRNLTTRVTDLGALCTDLSQSQEFDRPEAPWKLRAQEIKKLKIKPVDIEEELQHLKKQYSEARLAIAVREESLSTSTLRIETLEARYRDSQAKASRINEMEAQVLEAQENMTKLKDDIEKQDRELKTLESDRDKWKKTAGDNHALNTDTTSKAGREQAVATQREMDALRNDISSLQSAVRYLREDNRQARTKEQAAYDWLAEPLVKPTPVAEQRRNLVAKEGKDVLVELLRMAGTAKVYDLRELPEDRMAWRPARMTPQHHAAVQAEDFAAWKNWQDSVVDKAKIVAKAQTGRREGAEHRDLMRKQAARLRIQLPGEDGKVIPGRGDVQIVGSHEWEGLQGRLAVV